MFVLAFRNAQLFFRKFARDYPGHRLLATEATFLRELRGVPVGAALDIALLSPAGRLVLFEMKFTEAASGANKMTAWCDELRKV